MDFEDLLPPTVIRHKLFPFLDLESRVALNRCMNYPISSRIGRAQIEKHQQRVSSERMMTLMHEHLYDTDGLDDKCKSLIKVLRFPVTGHNVILLQDPMFVKSVRDKALMCLAKGTDDQRVHFITLQTNHPELLAELMSTCTLVITELNKLHPDFMNDVVTL